MLWFLLEFAFAFTAFGLGWTLHQRRVLRALAAGSKSLMARITERGLAHSTVTDLTVTYEDVMKCFFDPIRECVNPRYPLPKAKDIWPKREAR